MAPNSRQICRSQLSVALVLYQGARFEQYLVPADWDALERIRHNDEKDSHFGAPSIDVGPLKYLEMFGRPVQLQEICISGSSPGRCWLGLYSQTIFTNDLNSQFFLALERPRS